MAKILDAVLHGEVYKGKEHQKDGAGGVHIAEDGVLEIGYQTGSEKPADADATETNASNAKSQVGLEYTIPQSKRGKHANPSAADKKLAK